MAERLRFSGMPMAADTTSARSSVSWLLGVGTTGPAYRTFSPRVFCLVMLLIWCFLFASSLHAAARREPSPISTGADARLSYAADAQGNRVPDFSFCGYAEGDRPIPDAPVRVVVRPIAGDTTPRIQKAIAYASTLPPTPTYLTPP